MLSNRKKGFTLIEIVIVLAIAALIMVIVFIAITGAQKSQRDAKTTRAAERSLATYETYLADHQGLALGATTTATTTSITDIFTAVDGYVNDNATSNGLKFGSPTADAVAGTYGPTTLLQAPVFIPGGSCGVGTDDGKVVFPATMTTTLITTKAAVSYYSEAKGGPVCKSATY